jgi:hypothetical protein
VLDSIAITKEVIENEVSGTSAKSQSSEGVSPGFPLRVTPCV